MAVEDLIQDPRHRVRVFVVFWNYTLSMREADKEFRTDWSKLEQILSKAAAAVVDADSTSEYQVLNLYGSCDPNSEADRTHHRWATTVVDTFLGVRVSIAPRHRKRSPPVCLVCHSAVEKCPVCNSDIRKTEEKGIVVRMATDTSINTIVFGLTRHSISAH